MFSYVCWAAPTNVPINQLFGVKSRMGMGVLIGSPLMGEFPVSLSSLLSRGWVNCACFGGFVILSCRMLMTWWASVHIFVGSLHPPCTTPTSVAFPNQSHLLSSPGISPTSPSPPFDRFGLAYNISRVLLPDDRFDEAAYYTYSPLYLPATHAMT